MIIYKEWISKRYTKAFDDFDVKQKRIYIVYHKEYFLFGFIPLYISRVYSAE